MRQSLTSSRSPEHRKHRASNILQPHHHNGLRMKSFINSSSSEGSDSESREILPQERSQERQNATPEKKGPPRQSVFEYMYQQKVMITGSADLDEHIHSTRTLIPKPLETKKRKTFYDSSEDEEEPIELGAPNILSTPQKSLVLGDLLAKYSPPQLSPNSTCSDPLIPKAAIDEGDIWMESPQIGKVQDKEPTSRKKKIRKYLDPSSSEEDIEEVRPQLRTAAPVRELAAVLLSNEEKKEGPAVVSSSSPPPPHEFWINKYAAQYLKDYQIQGVQWLYKKYASKAGCILGYVSLLLLSFSWWWQRRYGTGQNDPNCGIALGSLRKNWEEN
jgi:SNF2 family DNA or RNA helicase